MSVPTYEQMMRPVLEALAEQGVMRWNDLIPIVAQRMGVTEEDRRGTITSGETVLSNRVGWALTYLAQAGAARRPRRGFAEITDRGRTLLSKVQGPITNVNLADFAEFQEFRRRSTGKSRKGILGEDLLTADHGSMDLVSASTPKEIIDKTVANAEAALAGEVLGRVMDLTPTAFEQLVLRLLHAMGYGVSGSIESTAASGDAGIDGVISQDPLGLDRIYVQAKRYAQDRSIGRPAMQEFVGALQGQQADRGVFMATCTFTKEALTYADRVGIRIVPIDGQELGELMLKHRVGVQSDYTATLLRLDEDFFESL